MLPVILVRDFLFLFFLLLSSNKKRQLELSTGMTVAGYVFEEVVQSVSERQ